MNHLKSAKKTIKIEAKGLEALAKSLGRDFNTLCDKLLKTKGKIITLGIGKSGHIAKKVSANQRNRIVNHNAHLSPKFLGLLCFISFKKFFLLKQPARKI